MSLSITVHTPFVHKQSSDLIPFSQLPAELKSIVLEEKSLNEWFKDLNEAINFAISYKLDKINLMGFSTLSNECLDRLAKNLQIKRLSICSLEITCLHENLKSVEYLDISFCRNLKQFPEGYVVLKSLYCAGCSFTYLPDGMDALEELDIRNCPIATLPRGINLKFITVSPQHGEYLLEELDEACVVCIS